MGKSRSVILSDLLFLEGMIILSLGILFAVVKAMQVPRPLPESSTDKTVNAELAHGKRLHSSTQMMIIGAILIGLSIAVGTLLR